MKGKRGNIKAEEKKRREIRDVQEKKEHLINKSDKKFSKTKLFNLDLEKLNILIAFQFMNFI